MYTTPSAAFCFSSHRLALVRKSFFFSFCVVYIYFCLIICLNFFEVDIVSVLHLCYSNLFHFVIDQSVFASIDWKQYIPFIVWRRRSALISLRSVTHGNNQDKLSQTHENKSHFSSAPVLLVMLRPSSAGKTSHLCVFNNNWLHIITFKLIETPLNRPSNNNKLGKIPLYPCSFFF